MTYPTLMIAPRFALIPQLNRKKLTFYCNNMIKMHNSTMVVYRSYFVVRGTAYKSPPPPGCTLEYNCGIRLMHQCVPFP